MVLLCVLSETNCSKGEQKHRFRKKNEEESGETTQPKPLMEKHGDAPELNVSNDLVEALKELIRLFSQEEM